jgi:hypothetical protein
VLLQGNRKNTLTGRDLVGDQFPSIYSMVTEVCLASDGQSQPVKFEMKGFKTSHFKASKTFAMDPGEEGSVGDGECPQSVKCRRGFL